MFFYFLYIFSALLAILALKRRCVDMEEFSCRTKVVSGSGTIRMLGKLEKKKLFLVADPFFVKNGIAGKVAEASGWIWWWLWVAAAPWI